MGIEYKSRQTEPAEPMRQGDKGGRMTATAFHIRIATAQDAATIHRIVHACIDTTFPRYYPAGVPQYFRVYHNVESIREDAAAGEVWLLESDNKVVGTVTVSGSEIARLYVLPECQGKGYGRALMNVAEQIAQPTGRCYAEAALPAVAFYLKCGYRIDAFNTYETDSGDVLCWPVMVKDCLNRPK